MSSKRTKNLSSWQRFKIWASRSFGCTSTYTIKDNDFPPPGNEETEESTKKDSSKTKKSKVNDKPNFSGQDLTDLSKNDVNRSFSKDAEDIPFMDASVVNIPQAVK